MARRKTKNSARKLRDEDLREEEEIEEEEEEFDDSDMEEEDDTDDEDEEDDDEEGDDKPPKKKSRSRSRRRRTTRKRARRSGESDDEDDDDDDEVEDEDVDTSGFTPEQILSVNKLVQARVAREKDQQEKRRKAFLRREKAKWEKEQEERQERENMAEVDRIKAEKKDTEKKANQRVQVANERVIKTEAKLIASELGVTDPKKLKRLFRYTDFSEVEFDDDGEPDYDTIEAIIQEEIDAVPELVTKKNFKKGDGTREEEAEAELQDRMQNRGSFGDGGGNPPGDEGGNSDFTNYRNRPSEDVYAELARHGLSPRSPAAGPAMGSRGFNVGK